jgi:hypothetical protein
MPGIQLARFESDVTPPMDHPLCGGWIAPVSGVDDPLKLRGIVLWGESDPVVIAALDWVGVLNESHRLWTEALADAAHTTTRQVAIQCVHQHDSPFVDLGANRHLTAAGASGLLFDSAWETRIRGQAGDAVRHALTSARPVTHVGWGRAKVEQVASNRRIVGPDGKIQHMRYSACTDPAVRALPEGLIDPYLVSVSFWNNDECLARIHGYATHPMSHYGKGRVSADFVGRARSMRDEEEPGMLHLYLTGCAGNITAGKYNDGTPANRETLARRLATAMRSADETAGADRRGLTTCRFVDEPMHFAPREDLEREALEAVLKNPGTTTTDRNRSAMVLSWLDRVRDRPVALGRLDLGAVRILFLPAETFVEYQLEAQAVEPDRPLLVAAYGDGGPWYIPLARSFAEGGYEPSVAWTSRGTESTYRAAITRLLRG